MSFYDVPKDVIRLWLKQYVDPSDYPHLLLTCSLFHVLTAAERSEKYRQLLLQHAQRQGFYERARKQHRNFKKVSDAVIDEHLKQCPHCIAVVKKANFYQHTRRCASKKGVAPWRPEQVGRGAGLRKLKCNGLNCRYMAVQHEMWQHLTECQDEQVTCIGCGERKPRREMEAEQHARMECWERPGYECDFDCGTFRIGLTRAQWADHRRECAESLVVCPLCTRWVQRQHLKHHRVKQQAPAFDNMGFTDLFSFVFGLPGPVGQRVDERKQIHTCASRENYSWYQLPKEAWGVVDDEKQGWEGQEKRVMRKI